MATPESFVLDIDKFIASSKAKLQAFATEFAQDIGQAVVKATPVKTGFLRHSWYAQINGAPVATGQGDVASISMVAASLKLGDTYYMLNGTSYGPFVEYGTSRMAPRAFVRGTVDRAQIIAEETAQRIAGYDIAYPVAPE